MNEDKKKKVASSITYTTGDVQKNIDHFNKMLSGKESNFHTDGYMNGTIDPGKVCAKAGTFASQSPDGASSLSTGGEASGGEGGGCCESLDLDEQQVYISKWNEEAEIPDHIKLLPRRQVEDAVAKLEPEEEFEIGYVTPIRFYSELDNKFDLVKCTKLVGYTGIDYIEARANDDANKEQRIQIAKDTAALGTDRGIHYDRRPGAHNVGDFSAQYSQTNKTVKQHFDTEHSGRDEDNRFVAVDAEGRNYETILFYPKVGSIPNVVYYLDLHNGNGFRLVRRDQLQRIILDRVQEIANELITGVKKDGTPKTPRWGDADLGRKIQKQLDSDAATISGRALDQEGKWETRSRISNGVNVVKPQVRALYTNQIYYIGTPYETLGSCVGINESLETNLDEAKRYVRRYYIRPQNLFCSNKDEVLKALIEIGDQNCSVYTLNNLEDNNDITKLTTKDIIYYYDDGKLFDKNHVKVMDYNLAIKHEEERAKIDIDKVPDAKFNDVYDDRMTDATIVESKPSYRALDDGHIDYSYAFSHMDRFMMCDDPDEYDRFYDIHDADEMEQFLNEWIDEEEFLNRAGDNATVKDFAKYIIDNHLNESLNTDNEFELDFDDVNVYGEKLHEGVEHGGTCCICGEEIDGYGNNPEPYMSADAGQCCDACNMHFVIPARLNLIDGKKEKED